MYQINKVFNGIVNFESILSPEKYQKPISVTSRIKFIIGRLHPYTQMKFWLPKSINLMELTIILVNHLNK